MTDAERKRWIETVRNSYAYTEENDTLYLNGNKITPDAELKRATDDFRYYNGRLTRWKDYETYKIESKPICHPDTRTEEQKRREHKEQTAFDTAIVEILLQAIAVIQGGK